MRRDGETGEFELVLGNGQLLSGLFIVVLLFAVFFALGYVVGQNSPRSAKLSDAGATPSSDRPQPVTTPASTPPAIWSSASASREPSTACTSFPWRGTARCRRVWSACCSRRSQHHDQGSKGLRTLEEGNAITYGETHQPGSLSQTGERTDCMTEARTPRTRQVSAVR